MILKPTLAALAALLLLQPLASQAGDAKIGRQRAQMCAVCHGPLGLSMRPDAPHIAGHPERYITDQLRAYRSGTRHHEIMSVIAKPLTDDEIANLAAWYASITVEATAPP
jgi:cytochrome c553